MPAPSHTPRTTAAFRRARRGVLTVLVAGSALACESGLDPTPDDGSPAGLDVSTPFPLDRGDEGLETPGKYKGLWLRQVDNGTPTVTPVNDKIGVVCIGMSNAKQECSDFVARITSHWISDVNFDVRVMNCAQGGFAIESWNDPAYDARLWELCIRGLFLVGLRPEEVRVIYHKAANQFTTAEDGSPLPAYPHLDSDYEAFYRNLTTFSGRVKNFFPTVQAVYTSSRSYGGFSETPGRGEPLSYEEGHALNSWLADHQFVDGIWYGWGAYLWAPTCDTNETNGGGVCYNREDYLADGVHPSPKGAGKMSFLMHFRLMEEAWYRRR